MYTWISGSSGPFQNPNIRGNFGRNATLNVLEASNRDPREVLNANIEYSPDGKPDVANALGYAEQDVLHFYYQDRGMPVPAQPTYQEKLNLNDLTAIFGDANKAKNFMKAVDTEGGPNGQPDGLISIPEMAAYNLYTDNSINLTRNTLSTFADPNVFSSTASQGMRQGMAQAKDQFRYLFPESSQADGVFTPRERECAEFTAFNMPTTANFILKQMDNTFQLDSVYSQLQKPPIVQSIFQPGGPPDNANGNPNPFAGS